MTDDTKLREKINKFLSSKEIDFEKVTKVLTEAEEVINRQKESNEEEVTSNEEEIVSKEEVNNNEEVINEPNDINEPDEDFAYSDISSDEECFDVENGIFASGVNYIEELKKEIASHERRNGELSKIIDDLNEYKDSIEEENDSLEKENESFRAINNDLYYNIFTQPLQKHKLNIKIHQSYPVKNDYSKILQSGVCWIQTYNIIFQGFTNLPDDIHVMKWTYDSDDYIEIRPKDDNIVVVYYGGKVDDSLYYKGEKFFRVKFRVITKYKKIKY